MAWDLSTEPEFERELGTPEQRERCLHPLPAGDLRCAVSMTEPNAGADPTLLRTRAVRDGEDRVSSGHKPFSSNATIADFLNVMAVTDPDARPHQRASMLLVDTGTPGEEILRLMVHRQSVARRILRGFAWPPGEVPSEHVPTRRAAAREKLAEIPEAVTSHD